MQDQEINWTTVATTQVLEAYGKTLIRHGGKEIAVFKDGERLYAIDDQCPHANGASLCTGRIVDGHVKCPAHGLRFRFTDGLLAGSNPGSHATSMGVRTYPVRIVSKEIQVQL